MAVSSPTSVTFDVPKTIALSKVHRILTDLGIRTEPRDILEVRIGTAGVYVEVVAYDDNGKAYFAPNTHDLAVHRISMRLDPTA